MVLMKQCKVMAFAVLFSTSAFAAKAELDTAKSKVTWVGKKVSGQHDGAVTLKSGELTFDGSTPKGGVFVLDMASIESYDMKDSGEWKKKLEDHLKSDDFFNVGKFPTAKFVLKSAAAKGGDNYEVTGDLTIKDITKPVTFPATIKKSGNTFTAKANFKIDRLQWEIKYNSGKFFDVKALGDKMIYDDIEIGLDLVASEAKEGKKQS